MTLKEDDIDALFRKIAGQIGIVDDGTHRVFRLLVEATLCYRDELARSPDEILTVGETQEALDAFMKVMQTHEIPKGLTPHAHHLVILWLQEVKKSIHH